MRYDYDWLQARSRLTPQKQALIDPLEQCSWTYRELFARSVSLAHFLTEEGIKSGDRVALLAPNHVAYIDFIFACRRIGAIFVPLNWRLALEELNAILHDCQPKFLAYHERYQELAAALAIEGKLCVSSRDYEIKLQELGAEKQLGRVGQLEPLSSLNFPMEQAWMMIYTGGTTGRPKGVVLTNRSIYANAVNTVLSWGLHAEDVTLTVMPMFHTGGLNALTLPILLAGGTVVLYADFQAESIAVALEEQQCTIVLLVPTMYHLLIQSGAFWHRPYKQMKLFLSGGAPCPPSIYHAFEQRGLAFREGYGLTEAGPNNFFIPAARAAKKQGSVGQPMMYNRIQLVDEQHMEVAQGEVGEIVITGEHIFECYWNNEQETAGVLQEGRLYTGDLARQDEEGDYYLLGRKKDMIITGGENVYPLEVEHLIDQHSAVQDVCVIGLPDPKWGEVVTAVVVPVIGAEITIEELERFCQNRLARYKVPKRLIVVAELPKTAVGKIDKKQLVERYQSKKPVTYMQQKDLPRSHSH